MQFLADHNIASSTVQLLRSKGYEVITLKEMGKQDAADQEVLELAKSKDCTLVTFDQDFADIISYPPDKHSGVIVLRIPSELPKTVNATISRFLESIDYQKIVSKLVILEPTRFRIRD